MSDNAKICLDFQFFCPKFYIKLFVSLSNLQVHVMKYKSRRPKKVTDIKSALDNSNQYRVREVNWADKKGLK